MYSKRQGILSQTKWRVRPAPPGSPLASTQALWHAYAFVQEHAHTCTHARTHTHMQTCAHSHMLHLIRGKTGELDIGMSSLKIGQLCAHA